MRRADRPAARDGPGGHERGTWQRFPASTTWTIGGLIALVAALVLWPARPSRSLLQQLSVLYAQVATTVRTRWADPDRAAYESALAEFDKNLAGLRGSFEGNLMRPAGLTDTDRSIAQLVDLLSRLRGTRNGWDVLPENREQYPELDRANRQFATVVADELDLISIELAMAVEVRWIRTGSGWRATSISTALTEWVQQHRGQLPRSRVAPPPGRSVPPARGVDQYRTRQCQCRG